MDILLVIWWSTNLDTWWGDNKLLLVNCLWFPVEHIINHRVFCRFYYDIITKLFVELTNQKPGNVCCVNLWTQTRHSTTSIKSKCPWPSVSSSCWVIGLNPHMCTRIDLVREKLINLFDHLSINLNHPLPCDRTQNSSSYNHAQYGGSRTQVTGTLAVQGKPDTQGSSCLQNHCSSRGIQTYIEPPGF